LGGAWAVEKLRGDTIRNYNLSAKGWKEILEKVDSGKEENNP
jgi:hypothetical protein